MEDVERLKRSRLFLKGRVTRKFGILEKIISDKNPDIKTFESVREGIEALLKEIEAISKRIHAYACNESTITAESEPLLHCVEETTMSVFEHRSSLAKLSDIFRSSLSACLEHRSLRTVAAILQHAAASLFAKCVPRHTSSSLDAEEKPLNSVSPVSPTIPTPKYAPNNYQPSITSPHPAFPVPMMPQSKSNVLHSSDSSNKTVSFPNDISGHVSANPKASSHSSAVNYADEPTKSKESTSQALSPSSSTSLKSPDSSKLKPRNCASVGRRVKWPNRNNRFQPCSSPVNTPHIQSLSTMDFFHWLHPHLPTTNVIHRLRHPSGVDHSYQLRPHRHGKTTFHRPSCFASPINTIHNLYPVDTIRRLRYPLKNTLRHPSSIAAFYHKPIVCVHQHSFHHPLIRRFRQHPGASYQLPSIYSHRMSYHHRFVEIDAFYRHLLDAQYHHLPNALQRLHANRLHYFDPVIDINLIYRQPSVLGIHAIHQFHHLKNIDVLHRVEHQSPINVLYHPYHIYALDGFYRYHHQHMSCSGSSLPPGTSP